MEELKVLTYMYNQNVVQIHLASYSKVDKHILESYEEIGDKLMKEIRKKSKGKQEYIYYTSCFGIEIPQIDFMDED